MSNDKFAMGLFWVFSPKQQYISDMIRLYPHYSWADSLNIWQLPFSISEKMRMISFNRRYVAVPESNQRLLDPQSDSLSMLGTQLQGIHEPPHDKTNKMAIAPSEDTYQPVHPPSLISLHCPHEETFGPHTHWAHCEDSDQTRRMPRLVGDFAGHKGHFVGFVMRWLTFRKCILIFASGFRNKPHFWRPCSIALWLQSQGSLVRAPVLPCTGYTCNLR